MHILRPFVQPATPSPTECTCLNRFDHCAHCTALEAAVNAERAAASTRVRRVVAQVNDQPDEFADRFINAAAVAGLLGIGVRTLWRLVNQGRFLQPVRMSRKLVRWSRGDVVAWLKLVAKEAAG